MKTYTALAVILLALLPGCASNSPVGPTIDIPVSQTLAHETAVASANETETVSAPTAILQPTATHTSTSTLTPTDIPTSTPTPTHTPLPALRSNAADLEWITAYLLPGDQEVLKIHPTKDGGFILLSYGVLLKLRADGLIEWQKSLGQWAVRDVLETSTGDFILAADLHWIKLDSLGKLLWQHTFETPSYHTGAILRLAEERNGDIVVEAEGSKTVFNAAGELQSFTGHAMPSDFQKELGNVIDRLVDDPLSYVVFVQTTADRGAIVGISVFQDLGLVASWDSHVSIFRISRDGSVRWQRGYGGYYGASYEDFRAVETESGDIIIAGTVNYFADNDEHNHVWILRLNRNGRLRWEKVYATEGQDVVTDMQELSNGDLMFAGHTSGAGSGDQDIWILKTNARGEIPNCGHIFDGSAGMYGDSPPEVEATPLQAERRPLGNDAGAQAIPLCSPSL